MQASRPPHVWVSGDAQLLLQPHPHHGLPDVGVVTPASCHLPSQMVGQHQIMGTTPSRSGAEGFQVPAGNAGVSSHPEAVCVCVFSSCTWTAFPSPDVDVTSFDTSPPKAAACL